MKRRALCDGLQDLIPGSRGDERQVVRNLDSGTTWPAATTSVLLDEPTSLVEDSIVQLTSKWQPLRSESTSVDGTLATDSAHRLATS
jgi:hypothetical protein